LPPFSTMSATLASGVRARAAATTVAPCAASVFAIAAPMPRDAPVTSATLPEKIQHLVAQRLRERRRYPGAPTAPPSRRGESCESDRSSTCPDPPQHTL
jgi:hypothetical protein